MGGMLVLKWKDWLLHSFDPAQAQASGLWVNWLHYGMLAALSLTIVATLSAVGLILAVGLLIAPGAIAFLLVRKFSTMLWVAVLVCMASMLSGTYASFFLDSAPRTDHRPDFDGAVPRCVCASPNPNAPNIASRCGHAAKRIGRHDAWVAGAFAGDTLSKATPMSGEIPHAGLIAFDP